MSGLRRYRLEFFGPVRLVDPDGALIRIASKRSAALLAMLALSRNGERTRGWLQSRLWGSRPLLQAQASLRRELANLRKALGDGGSDLIDSQLDRIRLNLEKLDIDVLNGRGAKNRHGRQELLEGIDLAGEELFEEWLREQRRWIEEGYDEPPALHLDQAGSDSVSALPSQLRRAAIAILPFDCSRENETSRMLADCIHEEIAISLSALPTLRVMAVNVVGSQDGQKRDYAAINHQIGADFLIEGSVRAENGRVRVGTRLIDCDNASYIWAKRFEGAIDAIFELQEEVGAAVGAMIDTNVEIEMMRKAAHRPVATNDGLFLYWRANAAFRRGDRESLHEAIALTQRLCAIEPDNGWAVSLAAFCQAMLVSLGWSEQLARDAENAIGLAYQAATNAPNDPLVLGYAAGALAQLGHELDTAAAWSEAALAMRPGLPSTLFWAGWIDVLTGQLERGEGRLRQAQQLSPHSTARAHSSVGIGLSLLLQARPAEAVGPLREAAQISPHLFIAKVALCAALGQAGYIEDASAIAAQLPPAAQLQMLFRPIKLAEHRAILERGIDIAGGSDNVVQIATP